MYFQILYTTIREINYTKKYESRIRLPRYCGSINTNLGKGYIFERIKDWDGKTSVTLKKYCENGVEQNYIQELLYKMYNSLLINRIQVSDFHSGNILVNYKTPDAEPNLVIIDGIGNSDYIKLCNFSKFLLKKKLIRKFKKLMAKLDIPNPYIH